MNSGLVGRGATPRRAPSFNGTEGVSGRVRKRALEEEAATGHLSPIDADHCSLPGAGDATAGAHLSANARSPERWTASLTTVAALKPARFSRSLGSPAARAAVAGLCVLVL